MRVHWIVVLFGAFLILSGRLKMMLTPDKRLEPEKNPAIRLFRGFVPVTQGGRFFIRQDGVLHAMQLFITLLFVEVTDIIFAVDSVPAIYALTDEPLIVFTSNVSGRSYSGSFAWPSPWPGQRRFWPRVSWTSPTRLSSPAWM